MKKVNQPLSRSFNALVLFEEDLREIVAILNDDSNQLKLVVSDYQYDSLDELLKEKGPNRINNLLITTANPYFYIKFDYMDAYVYCSENTPILRGMFYEIIEVLIKRNKFVNLVNSFWLFIAVAITLNSYTFFSRSNNLAIEIHLFLLIYLLYILYIMWGNKVRIFLTLSESFESFTYRNRDAIFMQFFSGVIGFGLGYLLKWYLGK
jgi:hypothetical protein